MADRRITPWTIVPGYGFAAPPSGGANGARELMRDGAVRIVERLRIGHVRVWDGKCRECAYAYPCPTITAIESVEPWATLARDGAAAAMGLTSNAPEPPPPDAPPDLLTPDEHKAVEDAGQLWNLLCRIVGQGSTRAGDCGESIGHVHAIQQAVLKQAAARAYPDRYRLLGDSIRPTTHDDEGATR